MDLRTFTASTLALLTVMAASPTPAAAQGETPGLTGQSPYTLNLKVASNPPEAQKSAPSGKQAAAFPIVYPISTTVAFVRGTADEFKVEMKEFNLKVASKKQNSSKLALPAAVLFLPLSAMAGFLRAPIIAGDKALTSKPFSKKAFCVEGDIEKLE